MPFINGVTKLVLTDLTVVVIFTKNTTNSVVEAL